MRRFARSVAAAACLGISLFTAVAVADEKRDRKELKTLYAKKAEFSRRQDAKALLELNTEDYMVVLRNGQTMNRRQLEERLKGYFGSGQLVRQISFTYEIKEMKINKDEAVVIVEQKDKRIQLRGEERKPHKVEANVIHKDTWVRT